MRRADLVDALAAHDALAIAAELDLDGEVTFARGPAPAEWLVDGDDEQPVDAHLAAHRAGRPSEAAVAYGEGVPHEHTVDRLIRLADVAAETGLLKAVCPVPATGVSTPGSWGVEDLSIIALARTVLPPSVRVRPHWARLGAQTCGVALAFGADDLVVPAADRTDVAALALAAGRRAVER